MHDIVADIARAFGVPVEFLEPDRIAREKRERDKRHSQLIREPDPWLVTEPINDRERRIVALLGPAPEPIGAAVIGELDDEHADPDSDPDDCGCPVDHDAEHDLDPDDQCGPFRLVDVDPAARAQLVDRLEHRAAGRRTTWLGVADWLGR